MKYKAYRTSKPDLFVVITMDSSFESKTYEKSKLVAEKAFIEEQLASIPDEISDEELLEWAKINYPRTDYSVRRADLEKHLDEISQMLESISNPLIPTN